MRKKWEFPEFRFEKKWNAEISEGKIGKSRRNVGTPTSLYKNKNSASGGKVILMLPDTFMNKSGNAVSAVLQFYKTKPKDVFLVHDDADIPAGAAKLSFDKHSAGHKGVESVMRALKTRAFWRFRIGIGSKRDIPAEKIVLKKWSPDEKRTAKKIINRTIEAAEIAIAESPERAMNSYNS